MDLPIGTSANRDDEPADANAPPAAKNEEPAGDPAPEFQIELSNPHPT